MNRNTFCTVLVVVLALCFAGCSNNNPELGGGGHGIQIAFLIAPPAQMNEGQVVPVSATVTGDSMNGGVDWSCSTTGATPCGAANFSATHTASGVSTNFTAPAGVETVKITATSTSDNSKSVSANVNVVVPVVTMNYTFYLSGQEAINGGPNFYSLAGTVSIDANGNVTAGVQDYNDATGITSPEPSGDAITGGTLSVNEGGQGTLTLITNNANVGVGGTETLGIQLVNNNHALVIQFDGTATSSGSLDLQTLPASISGGYAFTLSGVDFNYNAVAVGGVFSVGAGGAITPGILDINDNGSLTQGQSFTGMVNAADPTFGRGSITFNLNPQNLPGTVVYYVVNSKAIRIIDVDPGDSAIGSAFSQGANAFTNASLGATVFALADNPFSSEAGAVGMFSTSNTETMPSNFAGVGEDSELGNGEQSSLAAAISGTYNVMSNGYGNMTVSGFSPGNVFALGIYLTDPMLNLNDPNNTSTGLGGALVNDLDDSLSGMTGVLTPQSDPATSSFAGNYGAGFQDYNNFTSCTECEFDMIAQGPVTSGAISFTGLVSDPFETLSGGNTTFTGATLTGTPLPDASNLGRYSMLSSNLPPNPLEFSFDDSLLPLNVVIYQASGGQLFWLDFDLDSGSVFVGPLEAQVFGGASKIGKKKAAAQTKPKH